MKRNETEVYGEDILLGYRWFDYFKTKVRFPFGFGLSYTTFNYGKPSIDGRKVTVSVTNSGKVAGQEVVQFYVGDDKASVIRPVKELKHFEKIALKPGETKHDWVAEHGTFTVYIGSSSADIRGKVKYNY